MSSVAIGGFACAALVLALLGGIPIGVALGLVSIGGLIALRGLTPTLEILSTLPYDFAAHWGLAAVPMFLLMGAVVHNSGLTSSLFNAAKAWFGFMPGGLAIATNFACAGFAAASGSSVATAAAMGRLAIPEMLRAGYDPRLATAVVAAAGTLGSLIPPSILMVIYGWMTEQPISKLLIAGVLPGILTAIVYAIMISGLSIFNPKIAPRPDRGITWEQRFALLIQVWPLPILIASVIGSMYGGLTTATEAAAFGALMAIVIAAFKGRLSWQVIKVSTIEAFDGTATIFFVAIGAVLFTRFLAQAGLPAFLAAEVEAWAVNPMFLLGMFIVIYLILGCFLDPMGIMLLTIPIFSPIFEVVGFNMIWIGVLVIKMLEIGLITPPVGLNAFVIKGVVGDKVSLEDIFRGLVWFIAAELLIVGLLVLFPQISLFLPNQMN